MADGVSFDQHGKQSYGGQRPRRKGPNLLLIMLIAFGAFTMFKRIKSQPSPAPGGRARPTEASKGLGRPPYDFEEQSPSETSRQSTRVDRAPVGQSSNSDWSLEEVDIRQPQNSTPRPEAKKTEKGDWTLEEVQ